MNIQVYHDKIVIKKIDLEVKQGNIILGSEIEADRETGYGKVIAVGPGKQVDSGGVIPTRTQPGDIIAFNERIPRRCYYRGEELYILRESDADFIAQDKDLIEKPFQTEGHEYEPVNNVRRLS